MTAGHTPEGLQLANVGSCAGPEELSVLMDLLSHDILNKNQATLSYLELIHSQPEDERKVKEFAERAASQVKASSMLLDCIRRFVASTRKGTLPTSPVDLHDMLSTLAEDISDMFPFKQVTVDTSRLVRDAKVGGGQCVRDLFGNLVVNMVQLSPKDSVAVEVAGRQETRGVETWWVVDITAKAAVMPQGLDETIFSRFGAADVSKMARVSGAVFAGSIARALTGSLAARVIDAEAGGGCAFRVSLKGAEDP